MYTWVKRGAVALAISIGTLASSVSLGAADDEVMMDEEEDDSDHAAISNSHGVSDNGNSRARGEKEDNE